MPEELRIPPRFVLGVLAACAAGIVVGIVWTDGPAVRRAVGATFYASLYAWIAVAVIDGREHLRLEKHVTGSYFSCVVVPVGESVLHGALALTVAGLVFLARPLPEVIELRDWFVLLAPVLFLALGWSDELIYHRRRALHREDILHTVSHLASGTMLVALFGLRVVHWPPHVG
ncbi:MAG: hypothetical protein SangKO_067860 [Sandaracinaceae bacterium]